MQAKISARLYIVCPKCDKNETRVCHLRVGERFGPWYCAECGQGYHGTRTEGGADIELCDTVKHVQMLVQYVHDPRLKFVINGLEFSKYTEKETLEEITDGHRCFIDQHTCPSNTMRDVEDVLFEDEHDPHGIFEFVEVLESITQ